MNRLTFALGAKKILSVNAIYKAKISYAGGKTFATIYKSREAKNTEAYIKEQVGLLNIPINYPWVTKDTLFRMTVKIIFKSGYLLRDLDNCFKLVQDGIFRALDINDSHVVSIIADKVLFPDISEEKILVCLEEVDQKDLRYDILPHPWIIWGNVELSKLKPAPDKGRRTRTLYRVDSPEEADTRVFILSADEYDYTTSAKMILDIAPCILESKGLVYIGILEGQWEGKNLDSLINLINEMKNSYSGIKLKNIRTVDEIYEWLKE